MLVPVLAARALADDAFNQTAWSGGASPATATHSAHQTGWTQYLGKDAALSVINDGADLTIAGVPAAVDHTTSADFAVAPNQVLHTHDDDFNAGTLNSVAVSGGSVRLAPGASTGTYISPVIDTGVHLGYKRLFFSITRPAGTKITRQGETNSFMMLGIRTSANGVTWSQWAGYASSFFLLPEGNRRYIQYKAQFDTEDSAVTPELHDVTITFLNYPAATDVEVICTAGAPCDGHLQLATNSNSGEYLSSVIDLGRPRALLSADFDVTAPAGSIANLLVRAGSSGNPDLNAGAWTDWRAVAASGDSIAALGVYQFVQYKAELTRSGVAGPTVNRVRINYVGDPAPGAEVSLVSSSFNTEAPDTFISSIEWVESLSSTADVRIQIATAANQNTLESSPVFVGPDSTGNTWWNSANSPANGGCFKPAGASVVACSVMPPALRDGVDDRWFAWRVTLVASNGLSPVAPTLSSITVRYGSGVAAGVVVAPTSGLVTTESGGTAVFGIVLNTAPVDPVVINLDVSDASEIMLSASSVTFTSANWSDVQFVTVTGKDDADLDGDQTATVITSVAAGSDASFVGLNVADVVVTNSDNDTLSATITATDVNAAETGPDSGTFTITLNSVAVTPLTVNFVLSGAAVAGADYSASSLSHVTIPVGSDSATVTITPVDDAEIEGPETVIALLTNGSGYVVGSPSNASITLFDDEESPLPIVTVTAGSVAAREADLRPGLFTIARSGAVGAPLAVAYTVSGTATPGVDYVALPGIATIPGGSSNIVVAVTPLDDTSNEGAEVVVLTLGADANYVIGAPASATVTIDDNDQTVPVVTITATADNAVESGAQPGTFTITRSGDTTESLAVFLAVSGTATALTDYTALGGSVIIPAGSSSIVVNIAPRDDGTTEGAETVVVTLAPGSAYAVGSPATATVTIVDGVTPASAVAGGDGGAGAIAAWELPLLALLILYAAACHRAPVVLQLSAERRRWTSAIS